MAAANKALGLNVPILGNNPSFDPVLHQSPAANALDKLYIVASSVPFSADVPEGEGDRAEVPGRRVQGAAERRRPVRLRGGRGVGIGVAEGL